jgi:hypothetical protein
VNPGVECTDTVIQPVAERIQHRARSEATASIKRGYYIQLIIERLYSACQNVTYVGPYSLGISEVAFSRDTLQARLAHKAVTARLQHRRKGAPTNPSEFSLQSLTQ